MGLCMSYDEKKSAAEFQRRNTHGDGLLHKEELMKYIDRHAVMWSMLAVNLNLDVDECKKIAFQVMLNLVTAGEDTMNQNQFETFNTKFVLDPKGYLEFFQRTVFAAFDTDNDGVIDDTELDVFVNIFTLQIAFLQVTPDYQMTKMN